MILFRRHRVPSGTDLKVILSTWPQINFRRQYDFALGSELEVYISPPIIFLSLPHYSLFHIGRLGPLLVTYPNIENTSFIISLLAFKYPS